jgi:hypothetical protein
MANGKKLTPEVGALGIVRLARAYSNHSYSL